MLHFGKKPSEIPDTASRPWQIWTGTAYYPRIKPSAWGVIMTNPKGASIEFAGTCAESNNVLCTEWLAILQALKQIRKGGRAHVRMDNHPLFHFLAGFHDHDLSLALFKNSGVDPQLDLWEHHIERLTSIEIEWLYDHDGDYENIRADRLAANALGYHFIRSDDLFSKDAADLPINGYATSRIAERLQKRGFALHKGDAERVAQHLFDTGDIYPTEKLLDKTAQALHVSRPYAAVAVAQ